ncbi:bax inhibitor 1-like [Malus sylvestris]|uniref:bax inhibitor 1-like n=1 Tax=Malus sylvestris TaxID=3752 RepID=UPI0021ACCD3F|nr:bax inhibitor 1-like [Malus sylvestris]
MVWLLCNQEKIRGWKGHCVSSKCNCIPPRLWYFGCFSAAAMLARHREYLYLGGLLSYGLSMLIWLHFASSVFGGSAVLFKFEVRNYQLVM